MRYPATIAGLLGVLGLVVAGALFLSDNAEGSQRFAQLIGLASVGIMVLANNLRMDSATETAKETKEALTTAITEGSQTTPIALEALTEILRRSENRVVEQVRTVVANGHGNGDADGTQV